jgi:hypothetical protein
MKRIIYSTLWIAVALVTLSGCKKDSGNKSTYYIKGKKDGTPFTYSANAMAEITNLGGFITMSLVASAQPGGTNMEGLNIGANFFVGQPVVGTYSEDYTGTDYLVAGVYNPNSATIVWGAGIHTPTAKPLKITITSKTATEITGTWEGAFYKQDVSIPMIYNNYTLFTEGEFKLPIH